MQSHMEQHGLALLANGYSILPIAPREKFPGRWTGRGFTMLQWERYRETPATEAAVRSWCLFPEAGVGVICGRIIGIDIDVEDAALVEQIYGIVNRRLGVTPAVRIGREPRKLLVYRTPTPFRKMRRGPVEVLAEGQQFVAYGIHPAGHHYAWPMEGLHEIRADELPEVSEAQVLDCLDEIWAALPEELRRSLKAHAPTALEDAARREGKASILGQRGNLDAIEDAMLAIPNDDLPWDEWNKIGMALYGALGEDGLGVFDRWSRLSAKYAGKGDSPSRRWASYRRSPPSQLGAGTIYHVAGLYGWRCPPEYSLQPAPEGPEPDISGLLARGAQAARETRETLSITTGEPVIHNEVAPVVTEPIAGHPFPMEWFETPSLIGQIARWILETSEHEHPPFAVYNTLTAVAAVVGRRYCLDRFGLHPNLFVIGVAQPGSGKDHSRKRIKRLLNAAGLMHLLGPENFTGGEAIQRALYKTPSLLSQMDEIGKYLEVVKGSRSDTKKEFLSKLLTLYSASNDVALGTGYVDATDTNAKRYDVRKPNFNLYGTTNPVSLAAGLTKSMRDDGTIARVLFCPALVEYPYPREVVVTEPPRAIVEALRGVYLPPGAGNISAVEMPEVEPEETIVRLSPDAEEARADIKEEEHQLKVAGRITWGRLVENTLKIAMLEAICRNPAAPVVTGEVMAMAVRLVRWSYEYGERLIEVEVAVNATEDLTNQILKLADAGTISNAQVLTAVGKAVTRSQINERLQMMVAAGVLVHASGGYRLA